MQSSIEKPLKDEQLINNPPQNFSPFLVLSALSIHSVFFLHKNYFPMNIIKIAF